MFAMKRFLMHSFFVCRLKLNAEPNRLQRDTLPHTFFMMSQNRFKKSKKPTFLSGFQIFQLIATESILKISTFTVNLSNADSVLVNTVDFYQFYSKLINSFASIFHSLNPNESWKFPLRENLMEKRHYYSLWLYVCCAHFYRHRHELFIVAMKWIVWRFHPFNKFSYAIRCSIN